MLRLGAVDYGAVYGYSLTGDGLLKLYWPNARITHRLPDSPAERDIARGSVIPAQYAVPLPELASNSYTLNICLTTTGGDQVLEGSEFSGCLPVPVMVEDS